MRLVGVTPVRQCARLASSSPPVASVRRGYVPRRAMIYVPASSHKMLDKVAKLKADCVVLELEDGVAMQAKDTARRNAVDYLDACQLQQHQCAELGLRLNSVDSGLIDDDLQVVSAAKQMPQSFMVPKIDSVAVVNEVWRSFTRHFGEQRIQRMAVEQDVRWVAWIESSRALMALGDILRAADNLHKTAQFFKLDAIVFGSDDYCADIGATRSKTAEECVYARQKCVSVAKAFGMQVIDAVYIDIKDKDGLKEQCEQGAAWGFTGKQVIHPAQIDTVQESFAPSAERCSWATELIDAYKAHGERGTGAFTFRGQMIDRPLLLQAHNIVQMMDRLGWRR